MIAFEYISDDVALNALVEQYQQSEILVIDTEFVRTRTYYANLGLIQAYDGKTLALIDPVAINDMTKFWTLLTNQNIIKLVHSCSEDLEVFAHYGKCQPSPLFDSQVAASLANMGHGLGYAKLVDQCLQIELDKGESRTDWMKRPLTDAQLQYAANDVYYLYQLYPQILDKLNQLNRLDWVYEEGARLTQDRLDDVNLDNAYLKVKNAFTLERKQLAYLKVLASWRLSRAVERNLALGFVIKDHALIALARKQPSSIEAVNRMSELTEQEKRIHGRNILKVMQSADLANLPEEVDIIALKPGYKAAFKAVKASMTDISEKQLVPMEFIGSKRLIHQYLLWLYHDKQTEKPLMLTGWRGGLVADALDGITFTG